jgi:site-specific DNA-methyltransferase (adenine-specific)
MSEQSLKTNCIYNIDCLEGMKQLPDKSIDLVVTSPPYNCKTKYTSYVDEIPWSEYYAFIGKVLDEIYRTLKVGGAVAIVIPPVIKWQYQHKYADTWRDFDRSYKSHRGSDKFVGKGRIEPISHTIYSMMRERDSHMRETILWVKAAENRPPISSNSCMGCDSDPYIRSVYEVILIGSKGRWFHSGATGRRGKDAMPFMDYTKDVWMIPALSSSSHPAPFPEEIPNRLIRLFTHTPDSVVLDPFLGIGTTIVAAIKNNRRFIGFEIDKEYFSIAQGKIGLASWDV